MEVSFNILASDSWDAALMLALLCTAVCSGVPDISSRRAVHYEPNLDEELDRKQLEILESFKISPEDCALNSGIWRVHPQTIEHHGLVLQESGFKKLTASLIVNYVKVVKKNIHLLKIHKYIDPELSVIDSYMQHLRNPPLENLDLKNPDENTNILINVYSTVLKSFLAWRLNTTRSEIEQIWKTYPRIKHKSLKYICWALDILEHDLGFTLEKIRRHGYLIHSYPPNILDTLKRVPQLCGKDIKTVFHTHPKIIMSSTRNILATAQHLKRCYEVFTLGSASMQRRLQLLHTVPKLRPFAENPRVLQIVHYQRKVSARLDQLQELQRQCASLHLLTSNQAYFERFTREGVDRTRGFDVVTYLAQQLSSEELAIRDYLGRHPFWCSVSCDSVQNTLEFLLKDGFETKDILSNLHLVLYPRNKVECILKDLSSSEAVTKALNIVSATNPQKVPVLCKKTELALCLYFLEQDHHFTGNGIWNTS
ncbi:Uncharacterized protein GBIM_02445 [Gryllus bimaculatus]|nr:Uncharacterized protein GBIM_02445 [Gryllus bimaculatus]